MWQKEVGSKRGEMARNNPELAIKKYAVGRDYVVTKSPVKKVFVKPLVKNWKKVLNRENPSG